MKNSRPEKRQAILSIHDVTPDHLPVIEDIIEDLADRAVSAVSLAVIPFFHQRDRWDMRPPFLGSLLAPSSVFRAEVLLHGYYHQRIGPNERLPWLNSILSRLQSDHEDEFYRLDASEASERIRTGKETLEDCLGVTPRGFIPPAWAGAGDLSGILREFSFRFTEDHLWIYDLERGRRIPSPVIAFSTRNLWRETLSFLWARMAKRMSGPGRILRFVLHPTDYRSGKTRDVALELVTKLSESHDWCLTGEILESSPCLPRTARS